MAEILNERHLPALKINLSLSSFFDLELRKHRLVGGVEKHLVQQPGEKLDT